MSKLFGFHYLEKLGKQNKILGGVLKAFTFYNNYLSLHGGVFKLMEGCKFLNIKALLHGCSQPRSQQKFNFSFCAGFVVEVFFKLSVLLVKPQMLKNHPRRSIFLVKQLEAV